MESAFVGRTRKWIFKVIIALFFAQLLAGSLGTCARGPAPQPDPAGTATGDKTLVFDAAGNPFVVPEPTDKTAPDYAKNKKAFDEFQAQAAKEPLALKLADNVGHLRDRYELYVDAADRISGAIHASRVSRC